MAKIFSVIGRASIARVCVPAARALLRLGVSPDAVTVIGTLGVLAGTVGFAARGDLVAATVIVTVSAFSDLIDGPMARLRGRPSRFGAFLDSTCDRVADAAIFASLAYWLATQARYAALTAALICLASGQIVSYAKARAQSLGMTADVGIAERAERLIIIGLGGLVAGLVWTYALDIALWLLAVLSLITIGQRAWVVYQQDQPS